MSLNCNNLSLERGGKRVLCDVSAAFRRGEITAIVGPNGAGKSSLLMAIAGLLEPKSGSVMLAGDPLYTLASNERAKRIGYLPQSAEIAWDVAVESLVGLGRHAHGDKAQDPVDAAIEVMDLGELRKRPASELSGGERARALLARVLAGTPEWILADEPLAALDLAHQLRLVAHFSDCAAAGQGVVVVLHDLAMAMNHADNVLVLRDGALAAQGEPEKALTSQTIAQVWQADIEWLGKPGQRAFATR